MFGSDLGAWATVWSSGAMTIWMVGFFALIGAGLVLLLLGKRKLSKGKKKSELVFWGWFVIIAGCLAIVFALLSTMDVKDSRLDKGLTSKIEEKYNFKVDDLYDSKLANNGDYMNLNVKDDHVFGIVEGKVLLDDGTWYDSTYKFSYEKDGDVVLQMDQKSNSIAPQDFLK